MNGNKINGFVKFFSVMPTPYATLVVACLVPS